MDPVRYKMLYYKIAVVNVGMISQLVLNIHHANYEIPIHYSNVIMSVMASQITGVLIACSTFCSGADQIKHQSSASLAFVRGINRWPVNYLHKGPVTGIMFPFDDVIMHIHNGWRVHHSCSIKTIADMNTSHSISGGTRRHGVFDADFA